MSTNFYQINPKKLRSPLLDPPQKQNIQENKSKGKKTYFNIKEGNNLQEGQEGIETLFNNTENINEEKLLPNKLKKSELISEKAISSLEVSFKIAGVLIAATGGMLSLLEFINIVRTLSNGSTQFGNSIIVFAVAFIGTILANVICLGFLHLVRLTKYIYLHLN